MSFKDKFKNFSKYNPYVGLWLLVAVALIIVLVISFSDGLDVGFTQLKGGSFKETILQQPDSTEEVLAKIEEVEKELSKAAVNEEKGDSTVHHVLVIGDSMTSLLANRIADYGAKNGYTVTSITWDSSTSVKWSTTEKLEEGLAEKPDFIFIVLGINEYSVGNKETRTQKVKDFISRLNGIPFIWVGPPRSKDVDKYEDMVKSQIPPGTYFRSDFTIQRGPDGVHPTRYGAGLWVDSIMRWMPKSAHPLLSVFPDTIKGKYNHIYYNAKGECKRHIVFSKGLVRPASTQVSSEGKTVSTGTSSTPSSSVKSTTSGEMPPTIDNTLTPTEISKPMQEKQVQEEPKEIKESSEREGKVSSSMPAPSPEPKPSTSTSEASGDE